MAAPPHLPALPVAPRSLRRADVPAGDCLCDHCTAKCCRYFALPMEKPESRTDFDYLRWFLLHEGATAFVEDDTWYLLVHTKCEHLQADGRCGIYETRPQICRDYSTDDCEFDDGYVYERYFERAEQVAEYAEVRFPPPRGASIRSPRPPLLPVLT